VTREGSVQSDDLLILKRILHGFDSDLERRKPFGGNGPNDLVGNPVDQVCAPSEYAHGRLLNIVAQHRAETIARCYIHLRPKLLFEQELDSNQFEQ